MTRGMQHSSSLPDVRSCNCTGPVHLNNCPAMTSDLRLKNIWNKASSTTTTALLREVGKEKQRTKRKLPGLHGRISRLNPAKASSSSEIIGQRSRAAHPNPLKLFSPVKGGADTTTTVGEALERPTVDIIKAMHQRELGPPQATRAKLRAILEEVGAIKSGKIKWNLKRKRDIRSALLSRASRQQWGINPLGLFNVR